MTTAAAAAPTAPEVPVVPGLDAFEKRLEEMFTTFYKSIGDSAAKASAAATAAGLMPAHKAQRSQFEVSADEQDVIADGLKLAIDPANRSGYDIDRAAIDKRCRDMIVDGGFAKTVDRICRSRRIEKTVLTTTASSALVAIEFMGEYIRSLVLKSDVEKYFRVWPMTQNMQDFPSIVSESALASVNHTEGNAETAADFTPGNVRLTASSIYTPPLKLSNETLRDARGEFMQIVGEILADSLIVKRDTDVANGNGSGKAQGLTTGTYSKEVDVSMQLGYTHITGALVTLGLQYLRDAAANGLCWVGNAAFMRACMNVRDDDGRPIFVRTQTMSGAGPDNQNPGVSFSMMGIPVAILPAISGTGLPGAGTTGYLVAGKRAYYIGNREMPKMAVSSERYFEEGVTAVMGSMSCDGRIANTDAVCELLSVEF